MQIILVHPKLSKAKTLTITRKGVLLSALAGFLMLGLSSGLLSYVTVKHAFQNGLPFIAERVNAVAAASSLNKEKVLQENVDAMAVKLGQIQAQLTRLDALGERIAGLTGVKVQDLNASKVPGRGGPIPEISRSLTLGELDSAIAVVTQRIDQRADQLSLIESDLVSKTVRASLLPTSQPLPDGFMGSAFGSRIDPFTGKVSRHEGIDFNAPIGSPIHSAAGGIVIAAEMHPSYGNMIDIDHGNGLVTRYAHANKLLVKQGDIVKRRQTIAEVGSTGRSTGAHLHFEVRVDGEAIDPRRYLETRLGFDAELASKESAKPAVSPATTQATLAQVKTR